ncbi:MAG: aminotransferase class V-fold PLP-dependent enzyme [Candidatus Promineifilaceae bacterium]
MNIRSRFPIFEKKTYINSCSKGALSLEVREAYNQYLADWQEAGSPWELWVSKLEALRSAFARLINANGDEVAVTTSVSASVNALASAIDFNGERNGVVIDDFAFPTTAQIWHAQTSRGATIKHVPQMGNTIPLSYYEDAIDERTKLVSLTHVCYRNGVMQDVKAIIDIAHRKGAWVMLDSYQALGTMPIDMAVLKPDFMVGGTLKYLLGSAGIGFLYANETLLPQLTPLSSGWFSQANIFAMDIYANSPSPTARRFEAGTPPNPNLYAALAGLKLIQSIGLDKIDAHRREITGAIKEGALRRGFDLVTSVDPDKHGPMVSLRSHQVELLVKRLENDNVIVSSRDGNLRISPHIYNNHADVDRLMDCLTKHKTLLV